MLDSYESPKQAKFVGEILSNTLIKVGLHTQSFQATDRLQGMLL
ncbi:hypothetical protein DB42_CC00150 [Neochlamydia sp. EPS4]|nr:hypothetical protein DB42_CC00150 [Neochlamydia sp. EPS4]